MISSKVWQVRVLVIGISWSAMTAGAEPTKRSGSREHWVATWATAQQLMPGSFGGRGPVRSGPPPAATQNTSAASAPGAEGSAVRQPPRPPRATGPMMSNMPTSFADQTVRMIVHTSLGGRTLRIELSNMLNAQPLEVGEAHIALHKSSGVVSDGSDRVLTFGGARSVTLQPGVIAVSDPVDLEFAPQSDLAISIYLPRDTGAPTNHTLGLHTAYIASGNQTGSAALSGATTMFAYVWLSSVTVLAPPESLTVVALGDSITDGYATTRDADRAWPTLLARRLTSNKATRNIAVVNQGISGNQVLRDGAGLSALARFDRDVLSRPGVRWVILLEGINDINIRGRVDGPNALTSEELIWGYRQIIARCHQHGIKVMGATITPQEGVPTASERGERIRQVVNEWIRTKGNFDAFVDFDAILKDPQRHARLRAEFDPGDHIHPNDAGNEAMANAFDLKSFR